MFWAARINCIWTLQGCPRATRKHKAAHLKVKGFSTDCLFLAFLCTDLLQWSKALCHYHNREYNASEAASHFQDARRARERQNVSHALYIGTHVFLDTVFKTQHPRSVGSLPLAKNALHSPIGEHSCHTQYSI